MTTSSGSVMAASGSTMTISRPALYRALTLLVFLWVLASVSYMRNKSEDNSLLHTLEQGSQKTSWHVYSSGNDSENEDVEEKADPKWSQSAPPATDKQDTVSPSMTRHTDRVAVTIENRPLKNLIPVILHFHSVLGPEWPVILYTTPSSAANLSESAPFARAISEGWLEIRYLPETAIFSSHRAVSLFLSGTWLWQDLAPYEKVLLFQDDSILCSASAARVDDFLQWDLIGAPIDPAYGRGYNGGLSIRNRALTLDVFSRYSWANDSETPGAPTHFLFEDQWLYTRMAELPAREDGHPGARLPSQDVARAFAVETMWEERPLGFHQPSRWQKDRLPEIMKYCPEVGMISAAAFF
ncbi:hypothetical protein PFICI_07524 [Pestalotiopsis fici W106-1]|uniref:DUF5672 domain-containing protein n=1 Tax=Pestalotiopsis fici (strain W106-1 / CGMCC3.15140) TaxID=1229662 RepID=W3X1P3_PESFW|nr:uncharacterized protein PFICI_07524 [Pestalotiopsis fici W106-1]ETS79995.1 hypothetical protein PFICI_07524 [Pestalotiopsis fici W106-1]